MSKNLKKWWLQFMAFLPWLMAAATVLLANKAYEVLFNSKLNEIYQVKNLPFVILYFLMVLLLFYIKDRFFQIIIIRDTPPKKGHLVLFLSNVRSEIIENNGIPEGLELSGDIEKDIATIETLKKNKPPLVWPWEMPLRAIRHHLGDLKSVTLICSDQSLLQASCFLKICSRYEQFQKDLHFNVLVKKNNDAELVAVDSSAIPTEVRGWDFEDFDDLSKALRTLFKIFKRRKYREKDIMVDFTGGQKTTSIVATAMTVNSKISAQYVQTNSPWKVFRYDILFAASHEEDISAG